MTLLSTIFKFENSYKAVENSANWIVKKGCQLNDNNKCVLIKMQVIC
ncbi:hypothetical protein MHK_010835 [Candidatus Magnetomorum sp. HK-1]|nr:hypothetical protein MHK_010835 [Candidatus Magnetomorum sp. HK-1]